MEDGLVLGKTKSIFEGAYVLILAVVDDGLVLVTKPISFWEERKDDKYGCNGFGLNENLSLYEMIIDQYRKLLSSNIRAMFNKARNNYPYYKSLGY